MFFVENAELYVVKGNKKRPILFGLIAFNLRFYRSFEAWEILFLRKHGCAIYRYGRALNARGSLPATYLYLPIEPCRFCIHAEAVLGDF